ncbi:hypothetical protein Ddye_029152 [Dipteronia dyeriana]|uniref:Uncharacterized protein n=1 Tax=Dipteronia dyeriana TaxID=168575 RepID=A0AAD9TF60_9ROSI|nr:hypothetical protein Ddye_029152 [Dipteronia dyeriana]
MNYITKPNPFNRSINSSFFHLFLFVFSFYCNSNNKIQKKNTNQDLCSQIYAKNQKPHLNFFFFALMVTLFFSKSVSNEKKNKKLMEISDFPNYVFLFSSSSSSFPSNFKLSCN